MLTSPWPACETCVEYPGTSDVRHFAVSILNIDRRIDFRLQQSDQVQKVLTITKRAIGAKYDVGG